MMNSQKFNCRGGHRYFVRTRCTMTSDKVVLVDAIFVVVGRGLRGYSFVSFRRRGGEEGSRFVAEVSMQC